MQEQFCRFENTGVANETPVTLKMYNIKKKVIICCMLWQLIYFQPVINTSWAVYSILPETGYIF
jgi:hypothetical protein